MPNRSLQRTASRHRLPSAAELRRWAALTGSYRLMKRSVPISTIAAVVTFLALCLLFSGAPDNAGLLASISPVSAVQGLSFALAFGTGMPSTISILTSIAVLALVPAAVFLIARRVLLRYDQSEVSQRPS